jgi:hypothetical protein
VHVYNSVRRVDCVIATAMARLRWRDSDYDGRDSDVVHVVRGHCFCRELCAFAQARVQSVFAWLQGGFITAPLPFHETSIATNSDGKSQTRCKVCMSNN